MTRQEFLEQLEEMDDSELLGEEWLDQQVEEVIEARVAEMGYQDILGLGFYSYLEPYTDPTARAGV
jgi:hypothetical protein